MSPQCRLVVSITIEILQLKFHVVLRVFMVFSLIIVNGALFLHIFLLSVAQKMSSLLAAAAPHLPWVGLGFCQSFPPFFMVFGPPSQSITPLFARSSVTQSSNHSSGHTAAV
jgi:hypothetical protein